MCPNLETVSGLKFNVDFCWIYPERINPGDKQHRLPSIVKVTSGSNPEVAQFINFLLKYNRSRYTLAESIKVAEAAKVIENTQRDINIALMNELSIIFGKLNIDTDDVPKTKQNGIFTLTRASWWPLHGVDPIILLIRPSKLVMMLK